MSLVQNRTQQILSIKTQFQRATGQTLPTNQIKLKKFVLPVVGDANVQMAMQVNLTVMRTLTQQIKGLEKSIFLQASPMDSFELLKTTDSIGHILALVIMLETGDIKRFNGLGNYASYCRCVDSRRESNKQREA